MIIEPRVQNLYNLNFERLKHLVLKDRTLIKEPIFWRNENNKLWCYSKPIANGEAEFWIRIKDDDTIVIHCSTENLLKEYCFEDFFDLKHINNVYEFMLQEELLATLNTFIESNIIDICKKESL